VWVFTTIGFYSVVINERDQSWRTFLVRARSRRDLERLLDECRGLDDAEPLGVSRLTILHTPRADYPYRMVMPRAVFAEVVNEQIRKVDYGNFKDAVAERQSPTRAKVYGAVWSDLRDVEDEEDPRARIDRR